MGLAELANELLLGKPSGGSRYHQRKYPEGRRALAARAALAQLLKAEAPDGYYASLLAEMIAPSSRPGTVAVIKRQGNYSPLCGRLTRVWRVEILQAS
jgi:hypothetical protein